MSKIRICLDIPEASFRAYEEEARRRNESVESLLGRMIQNLFEEMKTEEAEGTDHPIFP